MRNKSIRRVVQINDIVLDYPLQLSSELIKDDFYGETSLSIRGNPVGFLKNKECCTNEVTIYSGDNGWVSDGVLGKLDALNKLGVLTVLFDDGSTEQDTYYFNCATIPLEKTPLYDGSRWNKVVLNLIRG